MKIVVKNLKQVEYNVEVESDKNTVKDLKDAIEKAHGFDANQLKLLHNGKVLENEKTLEDYQIKDENVVIMMNVKVKAKVDNPPPKQESASAPSSEPPKQPSQPAQPVEQPQSNQQNYTEQINSLVEMGYEKSQVEAAINASRGNVELAIEFLTNGIRDVAPQEEEGQGEGPEDEDSIKLKKNASILKVLCHKDPNKLITLLNNIKERQPDLYNLIKNNEAEFKRLLVEPINQDDLLTFRSFEQAIRGGGSGRQGIEIRFTKEEGEAIKRLKELGNFDQNEVIQAYIACDKNEEMTANYLFEQKFREGENNQGGNNQGGNNDGNQGQ